MKMKQRGGEGRREPYDKPVERLTPARKAETAENGMPWSVSFVSKRPVCLFCCMKRRVLLILRYEPKGKETTTTAGGVSTHKGRRRKRYA